MKIGNSNYCDMNKLQVLLPFIDPATRTTIIVIKFRAVKALFSDVDSFTPNAKSPKIIDRN